MKLDYFLTLIACAFVIAPSSARAGSATWNFSTVDTLWQTAANWTPNTVPNGPGDVATFSLSKRGRVSVVADVSVNGMVFTADATRFTIILSGGVDFTISGTGVTNNSGATQNIRVEPSSGHLIFQNNAKAGTLTQFTNVGADNDLEFEAFTAFYDSSSADHATFINQGATGSAAPGGKTEFFNLATADHGVFTNLAAAPGNDEGGSTYFSDNSSAGNGNFTSRGGSSAYLFASTTEFFDTSTAANATLAATGGSDTGDQGAATIFYGSSTADNATLIATGGLNGSPGGYIWLADTSTGGTAQVQVLGNAQLDISVHDAPGVSIGSLGGDGQVFLGGNNLTVGSDGLISNFSGVLQDGGQDGGAGGSLTKIGAAVMGLSGANTYTGDTTVEEGTLIVTNTSGSATGSGALRIDAGTFGGGGIVAGATTIGTGSGAGAILMPSVATGEQAILTIQSALTFKADATYSYTFRAAKNKARADQVIANGVTIRSGASFDLTARTQSGLRRGMMVTLISNTASTPIFGTFSNLPDGAILTVDGNEFKASYEGGDGNDLTLTVQ